jgi:hypothetical protein
MTDSIDLDLVKAYRRLRPADSAVDKALDLISEWDPDAWWSLESPEEKQAAVFESLQAAATRGDARATELYERVHMLGPTVLSELWRLLVRPGQ